ncbi:MAG TPA: hypothetical protein VKH37_00990 [Ferruginibacter sp.]|nr:hypothetical protein [Ferruginibacter sp.]
MKKTIRDCIALAIISCLLCFTFLDVIYKFLFSFIEKKIAIPPYDINLNIFSGVLLSLSVAYVPLFIMGVWLKGNITNVRKRVLTVIIFVGLIIAAVCLNIFRINSTILFMTRLPESPVPFAFDETYFEYFVFIASVAAALISYFAFRSKPNNTPEDQPAVWEN